MSIPRRFILARLRFLISVLAVATGTSTLSCASAYKRSVGGETAKTYSRFFLTDYDTAWESALRAMTSYRREREEKEFGYIRTDWNQNTTAQNFAESFGGVDTYLRTRERITLWLSKGFYNGQPSVKISIFREQKVMVDVLEGEKSMETDGVEENTILYRIGRLIGIKMKLNKQDQEKAKKTMESGASPSS